MLDQQDRAKRTEELDTLAYELETLICPENLRAYHQVLRAICHLDEQTSDAVGKEIIYFPLRNMITVTVLSTEQCEELKSLNNKGYEQGLEWKDGYNEWKRGRET